MGLFKSLTKSLIWLLFLLCIGFSQIGITYLFNILSENQDIEYTKLIIDGFFVFFSISLVSTVCFEFYFDSTIKSNKYSNIVIIILSVLLVFVSMISYSYVYVANNLTNSISIKMDTYKNMQIWIFLISALLTYSLKTLIYYDNHIKKIRRNYQS